MSYDELFRNNEAYVGQTVYYRGEVIQVLEGGPGVYELRVNVTLGEYGFWDDTVYLFYEGDRLLEDDIIDFVARIDGLITYESVMGGDITIPELTALQAQLAQ